MNSDSPGRVPDQSQPVAREMDLIETDPTAVKPFNRLAFVGTYSPRRCGIATFTADLVEAVAAASPETDVFAVAMNDRPEGYRYPHRVKFEINERRGADYRLAAELLNTADVDVVCVQHEYGIFGGDDGAYITKLLSRLRMPIVVTLHTVLKQPTEGQHKVLCELGRLADRLVVLAEKAIGFLTDIYQIPPEKITHIPHGIPNVPFIDPNFYKDQFGVEGKKVILTFGLLSPGKGIEHMIDAMPQVVARHPDAVYIVLGATHPHVQARHGEDYRTSLQRRVQARGVEKHVIFHNRFVELQELCEFLGAADVYVTPYLNEAQICSGTLAYALGAGNAVVSTPYWYAQELLANDRGRLVPFNDPAALASTIDELFTHEVQRHAMRKQGYMYTRDFVWPRVAAQYLEVFAQCKEERRRSPRPAMVSHSRISVSRPQLPAIRLDHLRTLTDDTGILQHARGEVPNLEHGYCTDDVARALVVVLRAADHLPATTECFALARRYLAFLHHAFNEKLGRFRNFMSYDRRWLEEAGSEDSHGRAVWALGETIARAERRGFDTLAMQLFHAALPVVTSFTSPRAWAHVLIGLHAYLRRFSGDTEVKRIRAELSGKLLAMHDATATDDWPWPEQALAWGNAHLPHAMILCGQWMFDARLAQVGLRSLEWLMQQQTAPQGHFAPIGNQKWYERGGEKSRFDQQPIEAQATIEACLEAHLMTRDRVWLDRALTVFNWFLGDNDLGVPLYDAQTGGCYDGLQPEGVNENQGAESTVAWLLSLLSLYEHGVDTRASGKLPLGEPTVVQIDPASMAGAVR